MKEGVRDVLRTTSARGEKNVPDLAQTSSEKILRDFEKTHPGKDSQEAKAYLIWDSHNCLRDFEGF